MRGAEDQLVFEGSQSRVLRAHSHECPPAAKPAGGRRWKAEPSPGELSSRSPWSEQSSETREDASQPKASRRFLFGGGRGGVRRGFGAGGGFGACGGLRRFRWVPAGCGKLPWFGAPLGPLAWARQAGRAPALVPAPPPPQPPTGTRIRSTRATQSRSRRGARACPPTRRAGRGPPASP
jgi:hypothetical protein